MEVIDLGQQLIVKNKQSGVYSFPDNWQLFSFGEITISSQYGISSSSGGNYSVPILKMNNLQDGHIDLKELDYIQISRAEMESLLLKKGDLLINRTNSPDLVGKAAVYDLNGAHVFASYLVRFRLVPSALSTFVNYFLNSEPGQAKLKLLATKAVSQANINPSVLKRRLFVPIPPLSEQKAIATALSDIDALIISLDHLITKKRDIKQATMQQLLTGKRRLLGFSEKWETKKIGEIAPLQRGFDLPTSQLKDGNYPVVYSNGVLNHHSFFKVKAPGVVTGRSGTIGKVNYIENNYWPHNTSLWVTDFKGNFPKFIYYMYIGIKLEQFGTGSGVPTMNRNDVHTHQISIPAFREQQAIATILSDMDAEIAALEYKREKTRMLKQGMMQELLTGKTRLLL